MVDVTITMKLPEAMEVLRLIQEYLFQGGTGFDDEALERVAAALIEEG